MRNLGGRRALWTEETAMEEQDEEGMAEVLAAVEDCG